MNDEQNVSAPAPQAPEAKSKLNKGERPPEFGGSKGPEPTRYGDWQHKGRCSDF